MNEKNEPSREVMVPDEEDRLAPPSQPHARDRSPVASVEPPQNTPSRSGRLTQLLQEARDRDFREAPPSPAVNPSHSHSATTFQTHSPRTPSVPKPNSSAPVRASESTKPAPQDNQPTGLVATVKRWFATPEMSKNPSLTDWEKTEREKYKKRQRFTERRERRPLPLSFPVEDVTRAKERGTDTEKPTQEEMIKPKPLIPACDLPIPLLVGPLLERTPLAGNDPEIYADPPLYDIDPNTETNSARIELVRQLVDKKLRSIDESSPIIDLVRAAELLERTKLFGNKFEVSSIVLSQFAEYNSDLVYSSLGELITSGRLESYQRSSISTFIFELNNVLEVFEPRFHATPSPFEEFPFLLPDAYLGLDNHIGDHPRQSTNDWRLLLRYMSAHFFYVEATDEEARARSEAIAATEGQSPLYRLQTAVSNFSLQQRLADLGSEKNILPPVVNIRSLREQSRFVENLSQWMLSFPPNRVTNAIVAKYKHIFSAQEEAPPEVLPLQFDPSLLVLSAEIQQTVVDPATLLEEYRQQAELLGQFMQVTIPSALSACVLAQIDRGDIPDTEHPSSSMVHWLTDGGIATLLQNHSSAVRNRATVDRVLNAGHLDSAVLLPREVITNVAELYSLFAELDGSLGVNRAVSRADNLTSNIVYKLTQVLNPEFNELTLTDHLTVADRLLQGLVAAGYVNKDKNRYTWVEGAPSHLRLKDVAILSGAKTDVEIDQFVNVLVNVAKSKGSSTYAEVMGDERREIPLWVDQKQLRTWVEAKMNTWDFRDRSKFAWLFMPNDFGNSSARDCLVGTSGGYDSIHPDADDTSTLVVIPFDEFTYERNKPDLQQVWPSAVSVANNSAKVQDFINWCELRDIFQPIKQSGSPEARTRAVNLARNRLHTALERLRVFASAHSASRPAETAWAESYKQQATWLEEVLSLLATDNLEELPEFANFDFQHHQQLPQVLEGYLRPFLSALCLSVMSVDQTFDTNITNRVEDETLRKYAVPNERGEAVLTIKSLTVYKLLECIQEIDDLIQSGDTDWQRVLDLLTTVEKQLYTFEEYQLGHVPPPNAKQLPEPNSSVFSENWGSDSDISEIRVGPSISEEVGDTSELPVIPELLNLTSVVASLTEEQRALLPSELLSFTGISALSPGDQQSLLRILRVLNPEQNPAEKNVRQYLQDLINRVRHRDKS